MPNVCPCEVRKVRTKSLKGNPFRLFWGCQRLQGWCTDFKHPKCIISRDVTFHDEAVMINGAANHELIDTLKGVGFEMDLTEKNTEEVDYGR